MKRLLADLGAVCDSGSGSGWMGSGSGWVAVVSIDSQGDCGHFGTRQRVAVAVLAELWLCKGTMYVQTPHVY
jgi:hypothetical protein